MPYYPSSQVKTNLYTTGDKYRVSDGSSYVGDYYINSSGEAFSGKTPQSPGTIPLFPDNTSPNESPVYITEQARESTPTGNYSYYVVDYQYYGATRKNIYTIGDAPLKPIQEVNTPTEDDYTVGEFQRYFLKKNNELQFIEVNHKQYLMFKDKNQRTQWEMYTPITISWTLVGEIDEVYNLNKNIVMLYETRSRFFGFEASFNKRFSKFHKDDGKVQTTKSDMEGFHIMPDGTKMKDSDMPNYNTPTKTSGY